MRRSSLALGVHVERADGLLAMGQLHHALGQAGERRDEIGRPRGDGVLRHGGEAGFRRLLHHDDAPALPDGLDTHRPIGAGARQDDGDAVATGGGDGAEEHVDGRAPAARLAELPCRDAVAIDDEFAVGRDHIDAIGLEGRPVLDLVDGHPGAARQDVGEHARVVGCEVKNDDVGEAEIRRELPEQALQRRDAARRGADGANGYEFRRGKCVRFGVVHVALSVAADRSLSENSGRYPTVESASVFPTPVKNRLAGPSCTASGRPRWGVHGPEAGPAAEGRESTISPPVYGPGASRREPCSQRGRRPRLRREGGSTDTGPSRRVASALRRRRTLPNSYAADRSPRCR